MKTKMKNKMKKKLKKKMKKKIKVRGGIARWKEKKQGVDGQRRRKKGEEEYKEKEIFFKK
jgi:hypothetical protein